MKNPRNVLHMDGCSTVQLIVTRTLLGCPTPELFQRCLSTVALFSNRWTKTWQWRCVGKIDKMHFLPFTSVRKWWSYIFVKERLARPPWQHLWTRIKNDKFKATDLRFWSFSCNSDAWGCVCACVLYPVIKYCGTTVVFKRIPFDDIIPMFSFNVRSFKNLRIKCK